jgi:hypothetical protein
LQTIITKQSKTINNLKAELNTVNSAVENIERTLEENDIPALQQAVQDLEEAINNLNQAIDEIPSYGPATPMTDGLMPHTDKAKLDLITVSTPVDLDELVARVTALENQ